MEANNLLWIILLSFVLLLSPIIMMGIRNYSRKQKNKPFKNAIPFEDLPSGMIHLKGRVHNEEGKSYLKIKPKENGQKEFLSLLPKDPEIRKKVLATL